MIDLCEFESPLGKVAVAERDTKLLVVCFGGLRKLRAEYSAIWNLGSEIRSGEGPSAKALKLYLAGKSQHLKLPVDFSLVEGQFHRVVLRQLQKSRPGQTLSYAELASKVGSPRAARAVGGAMSRNPLPIVVPCHRVLPQSGGLGNYTGGVEKKAWLLAREGSKDPALLPPKKRVRAAH